MPSEIRHILFSSAEVLEAVVQQARRSGRTLPTGSVISTEVVLSVPGAPVRFRVEVAPDRRQATAPDDGANHILEFQSEDLAVALLAYCRSRAIPIPMRAEKALHKFGSRLGLVLTIGASADDRAGLGGFG